MTIADVQKSVKSKSNNLETLLSKSKDKKQISFLKYLIKEEQKLQQQKHKEYLKSVSSKFKMSSAKYVFLQEKAKRILADFHTGHSMGCYRNLRIGESNFVSNHKLYEYSPSCTWRPTYGQIFINLTKKELIDIENIEGVWTIKLKDNKCIILSHVGRKNTYYVKKENCFIVGSSHGDTLEEATMLENKKIMTRINLMQDNRRFVSAEMVHNETGACWVGINAFCQRVNINPDYGYNLGYLKSLNDRIANNYLNRVK